MEAFVFIINSLNMTYHKMVWSTDLFLYLLAIHLASPSPLERDLSKAGARVRLCHCFTHRACDHAGRAAGAQ